MQTRLEKHQRMPEGKKRYGPTPRSQQCRRQSDTAWEIHYLALPSGQPQMLCFAERTEELTGYIADEILADREFWTNIIRPADRQRVFASYSRCKEKGIRFEIEYRIVHKRGSQHYVIDKGRPVIDNEGRITHIEGTINSVNAGNRTKTALIRD